MVAILALAACGHPGAIWSAHSSMLCAQNLRKRFHTTVTLGWVALVLLACSNGRCVVHNLTGCSHDRLQHGACGHGKYCPRRAWQTRAVVGADKGVHAVCSTALSGNLHCRSRGSSCETDPVFMQRQLAASQHWCARSISLGREVRAATGSPRTHSPHVPMFCCCQAGYRPIRLLGKAHCRYLMHTDTEKAAIAIFALWHSMATRQNTSGCSRSHNVRVTVHLPARIGYHAQCKKSSRRTYESHFVEPPQCDGSHITVASASLGMHLDPPHITTLNTLSHCTFKLHEHVARRIPEA